MRALIEFARKKKSQQCHSRRAIRKKTVGTRHTARWIIRPRALTKSQQQKSHFTSGFERNRQNRFFFFLQKKKETDRTKHSMRLSASEEAKRMRTRTTAPAHQDSTTRKKISNEKKNLEESYHRISAGTYPVTRADRGECTGQPDRNRRWYL